MIVSKDIQQLAAGLFQKALAVSVDDSISVQSIDVAVLCLEVLGPCPRCGSEPGVNIDCEWCGVITELWRMIDADELDQTKFEMVCKRVHESPIEENETEKRFRADLLEFLKQKQIEYGSETVNSVYENIFKPQIEECIKAYPWMRMFKRRKPQHGSTDAQSNNGPD